MPSGDGAPTMIGVGQDRAFARQASADTSSFGGSWFSSVEDDGGGSGGGINDSSDALRNDAGKSAWVQKMRECYYLQLGLAVRLSSQATLADESHLFQSDDYNVGDSSSDVDTIAYRLWVNFANCSFFVHCC